MKPWLALALAACIENDLSAPAEGGDALDSGTPDEPIPGEDPDPPALLPCDRLETMTVALSFAARVDCPWGLDDNLEPVNEQNRARVEEVRDIALPAGAQLCDLAVHSLTADLLFDDHVTITLGDVVLVGGGYGYAVDELPVLANLPRYAWTEIVDVPFRDRDERYYCIGEPDSVCVLPQTEVAGPLDIELSDAATDDLVAAMAGRSTLPFTLVTFGDDDEDDCAHTDLTLQVDATYTLP